MPKHRIEKESSVSVTLKDPGEEESEPEHKETQEELNEMYESVQLRKLFVGNISYSTTSETLKEYFIKYGDIDEANVPTDIRTKLSKGFGFVIYRNSSTLDLVMKKRPHKIDGRIVEPRRAIRREEADNPAANASTEKMYVGPLKYGTTEDVITEYFSQHGHIIETEIPRKGDHCFITFDDFDPVDKCVNMKKHLINGSIVLCKKGLTKTAMVEADQRYHQRKRRRHQREEREKKDYNMAKHGYNPQKDYWRTGQERAPHRKYPSDFGVGSPEDDKTSSHSSNMDLELDSYIKSKRNSKYTNKRSNRRSRSPRRSSKRSSRSPIRRRSSSKSDRSDKDRDRDRDPRMFAMGYPYQHGYPMHMGHPQEMFYPPPPSKEYFDRYYEYYYGVPPPQPNYAGYYSQPMQNSTMQVYPPAGKDMTRSDSRNLNPYATAQSYKPMDLSTSTNRSGSTSGASMTYYEHSSMAPGQKYRS